MSDIGSTTGGVTSNVLIRHEGVDSWQELFATAAVTESGLSARSKYLFDIGEEFQIEVRLADDAAAVRRHTACVHSVNEATFPYAIEFQLTAAKQE
jgi:hypothetical protein